MCSSGPCYAWMDLFIIMYLCMYLRIYLSTCLSIYLSIYLFHRHSISTGYLSGSSTSSFSASNSSTVSHNRHDCNAVRVCMLCVVVLLICILHMYYGTIVQSHTDRICIFENLAALHHNVRSTSTLLWLQLCY